MTISKYLKLTVMLVLSVGSLVAMNKIEDKRASAVSATRYASGNLHVLIIRDNTRRYGGYDLVVQDGDRSIFRVRTMGDVTVRNMPLEVPRIASN